MSTTRSNKKNVKSKRTPERRQVLEDICYQALAGAHDGPDLDLLVGSLARELQADAATLAVMQDTNEQLKVMAVVGAVVDPVQFLSFGPGLGLSAWVANSGAPLLLSDRSTLRNFDPSNDFGSYLAVPLRLGDKPIGVLSLATRSASRFTKTDIAQLDEIKQVLSFTVHCLQLRQLVVLAQKVKHKTGAHHIEHFENATRWREARDKIGTLYHNLNDSLAVLVGNAQCLLAEASIMNQKTVSRVRRIEETSIRLAELGKELLALRKMISSIGEGKE